MTVRPAAPPQRRIFDAHLHIVDPRFPLRTGGGYRPEHFGADAYRARLVAAGVTVTGGAVVAASFQRPATTWMRAALAALGPGFVGVVAHGVPGGDDAVRRLDELGVRAVRLNLRRGGGRLPRSVEAWARRLHELVGWHVEVYVDGGALADVAPVLQRLPAVVVDHLGIPVSRTHPGYRALLDLVAGGARVKASGFGRQRVDVPAVLRDIEAVAPGALLFGTDLPSTRAPRPFRRTDVDLVQDTLGPDAARRVLHDNAVAWYRPRRCDDAVRSDEETA